MIPKSVVSDWMTVSQEQIQMFANATCDQQWIHVDPDRAQDSPFGGTVAHGFLTLSLIGALLRKTGAFEDLRMSVNYGLNRVRFTAPVLSGSRIRGRFDATSVEEKDDAVKVIWNVTVEREQSSTPCCVGEWIVLYYR
ncbi:MAG: MaoC family dehydratase [Acidobacteriota bacterium]|nr:MaoC family dehydratase [Acidobacteriota bacterium]